ncbi:putative HTH-type transcriptional regulator [Candidatus Gugararchaeum adminiculabundum]|nr:putative HTH-type transcriptional regulator [Candidatus Gugararchaeum adminiculabundum]
MKEEKVSRLDEVDEKILSILQKDARASFREISKKLGISASTAFLRTKKLEKAGVIKKFAIVLDMEKMGWDMTVAISIKVKGGFLEEVEEKLAKSENVMAVYDITGDWDVLAIAKFKGREELNGFVKRLLTTPHVEHTCTYTVLNIVKEMIVN